MRGSYFQPIVLGVFVLLGCSPVTLLAQESSAILTQLQTADEYLGQGAYPSAKTILDAVLSDPKANVEEQRRAHLLLIKLYVLASNDDDGRGDDFNAQGNKDRALEAIRNCLEIPELRHTLPEPARDFPKQMPTLFEAERVQLFGSFQVKKLEPKSALVILDGDTLSSSGGELPQANDVYARRRGEPVEHTAVVQADGYKTETRKFELEPGQAYTPEFTLKDGCDLFPCWTIRGGIVAAAVGLGALLLPNGNGSETQQPLPGPPGPP